MSFKDFRVVEAIGKGSFASVYKVIRKSDNKVYALKRVKITKMSKKEINDALNEIRFLASIRQKNIVGFLEAFLESDETELCIVMEYCGCGDLSQKVERYKRRRQYIDENVIWRYLIQCLKALQNLHEKGICHRDIKAANTFLAEDGSIKIGDMNVSKRVQKGHLQTQIGTPYYMAPEIWNNRPYDFSADIWALGCMIYELSTLRVPFTGNSFPELKRSILNGRYAALPSKYSAALGKVIGQMLRQNQRERPTAAALLASPEIQSKLHLDDVVTSFSQNAQNRHPAGDLIDTIKVPQNGNLRRLGNVLPKPCYPDVRPNSPSSWIVAEQHKFKQAAMPPPPPAAGPPATAAIREPVTSSVPAAPTAAPTRAPLAPIAEDANSARPVQQVAPAQKAAYPSNAAARPQVRRAPAPPAPPAAPAAAAAAPHVAHAPGAYNRGRYVGNGVPAAAAGYPSRVVQRRIW